MTEKEQAQQKQVVVFARAPNSGWARICQGTLESYDKAAGVAVLINARQAIYFSKETGGEAGLAAIGPQPGSRISPVAPRVELSGVGMVAECSPVAVKTWEEFK